MLSQDVLLAYKNISHLIGEKAEPEARRMAPLIVDEWACKVMLKCIYSKDFEARVQTYFISAFMQRAAYHFLLDGLKNEPEAPVWAVKVYKLADDRLRYWADRVSRFC